MSWAIGWDHQHSRDIGYGVPALCDHPGCNKEIDRGLSYVCGGDPYGGEEGCGLFFCSEHLFLKPGHPQLCQKCAEVEDLPNLVPFPAKPDIDKWINHKASHPSWAQWRDEFLADGMPAKMPFEDRVQWLRMKNAIIRHRINQERMVNASIVQLIKALAIWGLGSWRIGPIGFWLGLAIVSAACFSIIKARNSFAQKDFDDE